MSRLRRDTSKLATASAPHQQTGNPQPLSVIPNRKKPARKGFVRLTLWPLVAATFFMVSGGTYGTEDIVHGAGYGRAILILLLTPLLWSLPTAFMIGELSSALPYEGGYYAWVRRAMGNFWGFQEAWLSLVASIFDMAIYPTLFVAYLTRMFPWFQEANRGWWVALAVVSRLRLAQYRRRESSFAHVSVAVLRPVGAIRRHRDSCSVQDRRAGQCRDQADHLYGRYSGRSPDLHVELHGLG